MGIRSWLSMWDSRLGAPSLGRSRGVIVRRLLCAALLGIALMTSATPVGASEARNPRDAAGVYLSAICPANDAYDALNEAWEAAGLPNRVRFGVPLPKTVLIAFKHYANKYARAGVILNNYKSWPDTVSMRDMSILVDGYYKNSTKAYSIFQDGSFNRRQGEWAKKSGGAAQRIRQALGLPPRPQGCPPVDR